jgi:TfoX/Sxy family transcriptional regulator of competence genes
MAFDQDLADRLREMLAGVDGVSEKRMFGGLAFLVQGHMAVAASGQGGLLVRCDPAQTASLLKRPHAERMEMRGREMDGWLRVGAAGLAADAELRDWVRIGVTYATALPPK